MEVSEVYVKDLEKKYKGFRLYIPEALFTKGINLVIGPNGSGKSTLLKLIAGFTSPNKGQIFFKTSSGRTLSPREAIKLIGYVGEDIVFPNIRVYDLLSELLGEDRAREVAKDLGVDKFFDKKYLELSAGYRKRVQLCIALGKDASILLLDEPFANIDILMIDPLRKIIEGKRNKIVIVTSHVLPEIRASTITILDQGRLMYHGPPLAGRVYMVYFDDAIIEVDERLFNEFIKPFKVLGLRTSYEKLIERLRENST